MEPRGRDKLFLIIIVAMILIAGCAESHEDFIHEMMHRADWNESNGKPKDFMLRVKYVDNGITFTPTFIIHPLGREEDCPKDMEMIEISKDGLEG